MIKKNTSDSTALARGIGYILTIGGPIGLLAAFVLTVEKIRLIENPAYQPSCNISPLISCGSVMKTHQSAVFGFPNSLIGIAGFAMVAAIGMALLAGGRFRRWFWIGLQAGVTFGIGFVIWLQYQSIYVIGALCPYCMVVWSVMIPIFWYVTLYNFGEGHVRLPLPVRGKSRDRLVAAGGFIRRHHGDILGLWYLLVVGLILYRFWYYWQTLL